MDTIQKNPEENNHTESALARTLTTFDLVCLGINGVIGTGIFVLPGVIAVQAGAFSPVLFLICGLICFSIALCFAEMGGTFTRTGGAYVYATEAFGPFVGFMVGWEIWVASIIGWACVASMFGVALDHFYPGLSGSFNGKIVLAALIVLLSFLNFFGVKMGAYTSNFFTLAKLIPLALFVVFGIPHVKLDILAGHGFPGWGLFLAGLLPVLYTFTGFEELPLPASEVKEPQKAIPRAIFIVIIGVTFFYALLQLIAQGSLASISAEKTAPLAKAAFLFAGVFGSVLMGVGAIVSMAGVNAGIALTGPRSLYALARDRFLPSFLAHLHPSFKSPYVSILVNSAVVLFLTLSGTFIQLVNYSALASLLQYIPTCLAVIVLRITRPDLKRGYKVPGGFIIPAVAIITCLWLFSHAQRDEIIGSLVVLLISVPLYFLSMKRRKNTIK